MKNNTLVELARPVAILGSQAKLAKIKKWLVGQLLERDDLVNGLLVALCAGEHVFVRGIHGTAKSLAARLLADCVDDSGYFDWQLSKYTVPEELNGPISVKGLQEDRYKRITTGKLPEAILAFIDEFMDGSNAIRRSLLGMMNERIFHNDGKAEAIALRTLVVATNFMQQQAGEAAVYDRFLLKYEVEDCVSEEAQDALLWMKIPEAAGAPPKMKFGRPDRLTVDDLVEIDSKVRVVKIDKLIFNTTKKIIGEVQKDKIRVSDRMKTWVFRALQAQAFVNGHSTVDEDDLSILGNVLWTDPKDIVTVKEIVAREMNPVSKKAADSQTCVEATMRNLGDRPDDAQLGSAMKTVKETMEELRAFMQENDQRSHTKANGILAWMEKVKSDVRDLQNADSAINVNEIQ